MLDSVEGTSIIIIIIIILLLFLLLFIFIIIFLITVGPSRMRKRLCRNYLFYEKYCYDPLLETNKVHISVLYSKNPLVPLSLDPSVSYFVTLIYYTSLPCVFSLSLQGGKHQNPTSYHSPLYEARSTIFSDSSLLSHSFSSPPSHIAMTTPRARESSFSSTQQNNPLSGLGTPPTHTHTHTHLMYYNPHSLSLKMKVLTELIFLVLLIMMILWLEHCLK